MFFAQKKLAIEWADNLRICPIESMSPFALTLAPTYVFMRRNEKFVSVKEPMDFFAPEELTKLASFENFFVPKFVDTVLPFRDAAHKIRFLLTYESPQTRLPFPPYEVSDVIFQSMADLWGRGVRIEPYYVTAFVNELTDLIPAALLRSARDQDVDLYETALFRSAWAVFIALHVGLLDHKFLSRLRLEVFQFTLKSRTTAANLSEISDLIHVVEQQVKNSEVPYLGLDSFKSKSIEFSARAVSRLNLFQEIFGELTRDPVSVKTLLGSEESHGGAA